MGASRKLQGEIDRVLKKVLEGVDLFDIIWIKVYDTDNANQKEKYEADLKKEIKKLQRYRDQIKTWMQSSEIKDKKALMDARKQIEREMERFKICEKEFKTKAFSKEGLGQQPKTDPKEKAKSETRDWINNVVGELESQIDNFEAEIEGLTVKKGKNRPPRLTHLETSITRHKAHIMKLELILRLLDNEELSTEQVNDVKDFLEDYLERNQEDFDEFSDVDELYCTLPLDKVEALEDLVAIGQPSLVKGIKSQGGAASSSVASLKISVESSPLQTQAAVTSPQQSVSQFEHHEEVASLDNSSDVVPKTPFISNLVSNSSLTSPVGSHTNLIPVNGSLQLPGTPIASATASGSISARGILESAGDSISSSSLNITTVPIDDDALDLPGRKTSMSFAETGVVRGIGMPGMSGQSANLPLDSGAAVPGSCMTLGTVPLTSDVRKNNVLGAEEKLLSSGMLQPPLAHSLSNRILLPQSTNSTDGTGTAESSYVSDPAVATGRTFTSSVTPAMQWRPGSPFQNPNEMGQFRGRTEIAPDQREKFLQRLQQVQQQGPSNLLGMHTLGGGNNKQLSGQQQNPLLQQLNSPSSALPSQVGLGINARGLSTAMPGSLEKPPPSIYPQATQQGSLLNGPEDPDGTQKFVEEQQPQNLSDDSTAEVAPGTITQSLTDVDPQTSSTKDVPAGAVSGSLSESALQRDIDLSASQPLLSSQPSSLGVIGRRSVLDLGAIDDNLGATTPSIGGMHDQLYNYKMLESAFYKLPQPKDSERAKSYTPRHPAVTPSSYPQAQAPVINNPAFWERMAYMPESSDTLFFAFYFQQKTYQQYLAAKALKRQAWRFHRQYNTWFQRHEEPEEATDDYEKGSYVYFDFHLGEDDQGWCQRIKQDFTFEYGFLEDELVV